MQITISEEEYKELITVQRNAQYAFTLYLSIMKDLKKSLPALRNHPETLGDFLDSLEEIINANELIRGLAK